jgi:hypothetical protein
LAFQDPGDARRSDTHRLVGRRHKLPQIKEPFGEVLFELEGMEAYVIHPTRIPVSRKQRRAKTDRLDTALLMRAVLGWLRG